MGEERAKTIEEYVAELVASGKGRVEAIREVYEGAAAGRLTAIDPDPPSKFDEYILRPDYSLWLWCIAAVVTLTYVVTWASAFVPALVPLRVVLGALLILFIPGYVMTELLYAGRGKPKPVEELGLSVGASLALVPLIGLAINLLGLPLTFEYVATATSLYVLAASVAAAYRKFVIVKRAGYQ